MCESTGVISKFSSLAPQNIFSGSSYLTDTGDKKNINMGIFFMIMESFPQFFRCFNFLTFLFGGDRFPIGRVVTNLFHCPRSSHPSGLTNNLETSF